MFLNLSAPHHVVSAQSHYYEQPTAVLYLDRTLRYHDLIYLEKGQWLFTENNTDYLLDKDSVLLLAAEHHHFTRLPCKAGTRTMCIHITADASDTEASGTMIPTLTKPPRTSKIYDLFKQIVSLFWTEEAFKEEKMDAYLSLLLLECATVQSPEKNSIASEIVRLIRENPHTSYRLADLEEFFDVSAKTVESAMKTSVGMSFAKYQMTCKLEMVAHQLVIEPDVRLRKLAQTFGFSDEFHLSRAFKSRYGIAPTEYRKREAE